jgi:hypothetical protein
MNRLMAYLFGCTHKNCGWPITYRAPYRITVRVCLDCGRVRKYDWQTMRFVEFERGEERRLLNAWTEEW